MRRSRSAADLLRNMHFSYTSAGECGGTFASDPTAVLADGSRDGCKNDVVKFVFPALTDPRYRAGSTPSGGRAERRGHWVANGSTS